MTTGKDIDRIADLIGSDPLANLPIAKPLNPEVRSGATFPFFGAGQAVDALAPYLVIWIYSVPIGKRDDFAKAAGDFERALGDPPTVAEGLTYRGTYSVSISSAAPDFEYRTIWGLSSLANVETLNQVIAGMSTPNLSLSESTREHLQAMLKLIDLRPPMRAEIMGLSKFTVKTAEK